MFRRTFSSILPLISVLGLIALGLIAPPDGQERGDWMPFLGGFHPLAVHLPIALLLLVPVLEIAGRSPRHTALRGAARFVLGLAALSAVVTPLLGWLLARGGGFEGAFVTQHMWGGISVAVLALLCWKVKSQLVEPNHQNTGHTKLWVVIYSVLLASAMLLVAFTGYRGGQLAHGENHLTEHLPVALRSWIGTTPEKGRNVNDREKTFYSTRIVPIFDEHCVLCHNGNKRKGGLQLDSYEGLLRGGKDGAVIVTGNAKASELVRRISLNPAHQDFMPAEGKPPLGTEERTLISLWIDAGASVTLGVNAIVGAPEMRKAAEPWAPDYRAEQSRIAQLERDLKIRLVPRSENPTDGLILRTVSNPTVCDDAVLAKLAPVARYIVDAELARTRVSDAGLTQLALFENLRTLDLSHTVVTSVGVKMLISLPKLETVNLTDTEIGEADANALRANGSIKHLFVFQTKVTS